MSGSFVAEIIGPAGSGKTSLSRLLHRGDVRVGLSVWGLPPVLLALSTFASLPTLFALGRSPKRVGWDDVKLVIQLNALRLLLHRESLKGYQTLLLDEGTVFALAKLYSFGAGHTAPDDSDLWMQGLFDRLAPLLDAVIWLDAPDAVLAQRIRQRDKAHRVKGESDAEICKHLAAYRKSFEWIISELSRRNGIKVFRFSTDQASLEEIAAQVLAQARVRV